MRVAPQEGAGDGGKDLRRAGRDEGVTGGAPLAARRAAANRGRSLARLERPALLDKRGKLAAVRSTAARARPLYARLHCRAPGRRRHLQRVPHLRRSRGGGRLGDDLREPVDGGRGADLVRAHRHGPDRGLRPQVPVLFQGHAPRTRAIGVVPVSPRAGLGREVVVEAAASLADEKGLEAVTLSGLASELGIRTPSLYNHVAGLGGLRRELALMGVHELGQRLSRAAAGKAADEGIFGLAQAYRGFVKERPGLYAATVRSYRLSHPDDPELAQAEGRAFEPVLAVLASYGLSGEEALHAARGLRSVAHGFATLEVAGGFGIALDPEESFVRLLRAFAAGLRDRRAVQG